MLKVFNSRGEFAANAAFLPYKEALNESCQDIDMMNFLVMVPLFPLVYTVGALTAYFCAEQFKVEDGYSHPYI